MPYVDSNVFLYPALYAADVEPKAMRAKEVIRSIESGELIAATSTLTWDEVVWVVTKYLGRVDGLAQGQKLLGFPNLEFINVDERIIAQAQALMGKYKLSPRDALHIASVLSKKMKTILCDNEGFDQIKEIKRTSLK